MSSKGIKLAGAVTPESSRGHTNFPSSFVADPIGAESADVIDKVTTAIEAAHGGGRSRLPRLARLGGAPFQKNRDIMTGHARFSRSQILAGIMSDKCYKFKFASRFLSGCRAMVMYCEPLPLAEESH